MNIIVSLEKLQSDSEIIATNASINMEGIGAMLPNFFTDVKNFIGDVLNVASTPFVGLLDGHGFLGTVKHTSYSELMDLTIHVPMGFQGRMSDYIRALQRAQNIAELLTKDVLNPFNVWIGLNLADPTRLASVVNANHIPGFKLHDTETVRKAIAKHIHSGSPTSEVPFGQVFSRNQDWVDAVHDVNKLIAEAAAIKNQEILDVVASVSKNLDDLLDKIKTDPETYRTLPNTVKAISTICFSMAKECEFYAFYRHLLVTLQLSMLDTEKVLKGKIEATKLIKD